MGIRETFAALRLVRSPHVAPALLTALDADGHASLQAHVVKALLSERDDNAHRAILYRYNELPELAQVAVRNGAQALRNVIREAAADGTDDVRDVALMLLEANLPTENAELLAEFLADQRRDFAQRAEQSLRKILDTFYSEREAAEEAAAEAEGKGVSYDAPNVRRRAQVQDRQRLLFRAMKIATETLQIHAGVWVLEACLKIGGECRALVTEALRTEREQRAPGPVEKFLAQDDSATVLEYLLDRVCDHRAEIRAAALRALSVKRGAELNTNLAYLLDDRIDDDRLRKVLTACGGVPFLTAMEGFADRYSPNVLRRLLREAQRLPVEERERADMLGAFTDTRESELAHGCVNALRAMPADIAAPVLLRLCHSHKRAIALAAFNSLVEDGHPRAMKAAAALLDSEWDDLRESAARYIATRAFKRYVNSFDRMSEAERRKSAEALRHVDETVIAELQQQISDADPAVRLRALRLLDLTSNVSRARDHVLQLMRDPDARVRATVVQLLSSLRSGPAVEAIGGLLNDPDTRVRANAIEAIESLNERSLARALVPFLKDDNNRIRANAAKALYTMGVHESAGIMRGMLDHEQPLMRMSAVWAIRETRPPGGEEWLRERLEVEQDAGIIQRIEFALMRMAATERAAC
jgi:HEAT repeat protein